MVRGVNLEDVVVVEIGVFEGLVVLGVEVVLVLIRMLLFWFMFMDGVGGF